MDQGQQKGREHVAPNGIHVCKPKELKKEDQFHSQQYYSVLLLGTTSIMIYLMNAFHQEFPIQPGIAEQDSGEREEHKFIQVRRMHA
jgi:hypothetical protein